MTRSSPAWSRARSIWSAGTRTIGMAPATAARRTRRKPAALRPAPGWAQHRMPIAGLYQTGSTTHPGGSISGGPGRNAAAVMLNDFGRSLDEIVAKRQTVRQDCLCRAGKGNDPRRNAMRTSDENCLRGRGLAAARPLRLRRPRRRAGRRQRVTIVVPFGAGSVTDILARILADDMSRRWKQQVIVENRPGLPAPPASPRRRPTATR